jgi:hypothetical protein
LQISGIGKGLLLEYEGIMEREPFMSIQQWLFVLGVLTSSKGAAKTGFEVDQSADKLRHLAEGEFPGPDGSSEVLAVSVGVVAADAHRISFDVSLRRKPGGCGAGFTQFETDEDCRIVGASN